MICDSLVHLALLCGHLVAFDTIPAR